MLLARARELGAQECTLEGGKVKLTDASGQSGDVEIQAGDTLWRAAEEHSALNVGATELHALLVELK